MLKPQLVLKERYRLDSLLSKNAARQTWLATDLSAQLPETEADASAEISASNRSSKNSASNSAQVVVKLLAFGGDVQWDDLKLFEREAQILKQLEHPRIPQYIDYFSIDDRVLWFGLVEEYIAGKSFKELLINQHRFSEAQVRQIATETLEILIDLHELNPAILHRDIKPSNLILGEDNHVYLVDFGAVQDKAAKEGVTFTVVGTYGYAPMEQFGGKAVAASDLYGLGATLIHLLTGISPADLPVRDMRIQFVDKVNISNNLEYWLERITEPSVEKRFPTARQALFSLKENQISRQSNQKITLPIGSKIFLQKTADIFTISLPNPHTNSLGRIGNGISALISLFFITIIFLIVISTVGIFFGLTLLIFGLMFAYSILLSYFAHQRIVLTAEMFEIQLWLFRWCIRRKIDLNTNIQDVFQSIMHSGAKGQFQLENLEGQEMVTIQTDATRYSFGLGLSQIECLWLAQEIKDWVRSHSSE